MKWYVAVIFAVASSWAGAKNLQEPTRAEFALRWQVTATSPRSLDAVISALGLARSDFGDAQYSQVRYAVLSPHTPNLLNKHGKPRKAHTTHIVRMRCESAGAAATNNACQSAATWTLKRRGIKPLSEKQQHCLQASADKFKYELDISVLSRGNFQPAYSFSCDYPDAVFARSNMVTPAELQAINTKTSSQVQRWQGRAQTPAAMLTIEIWRLPDQRELMDISQKTSNTVGEFHRFIQTVVQPLLNAGAVPLDRSKTEMTQ